MTTNSEIISQLQLMGQLLDLKGDNPFRIRAYERAAQSLSGVTRNIVEMTDEELNSIPGIGAGMIANIKEMARAGSFKELEALKKQFPKGLFELLKVQGLGPKRAKKLYEQLRIDSVEKLKEAAREGKLREIEGFGEKTEKNILDSMRTLEAGGRRMIFWEARFLMQELLATIRNAKIAKQLAPAGSLARGRETVGDLDIVAACANPAKAVEAFTRLPQVERVIGAGPTKATVWLKSQIQCDFRAVGGDSFGAAQLYFTGSKEHNVALRERAIKLGFSLNEYGLLKKKKKIAGKTEEEIYKKLGLAWIPPELRENRGEIEAAEKNKLPKLVEMKDVKGDFHNHTNLTDGSHTLEDMAKAAEKMGWEWIFLGDHSQSLKVAHGLSPAKLRETIKQAAELNARSKNFRIFRSMEVDILKDGSLDYDEKDLSSIGAVIGSVHSHFQMPEEEMTRRIERAAENPHMDIVGHLSGRLINRRPGYQVNAERVLERCAETGAAIEINGQPDRQDITDVQARRAKELGVPLALDTDAHSVHQFSYMELAVNIARRAWLTKDDILNSKSATEIQSWLKERSSTKVPH